MEEKPKNDELEPVEQSGEQLPTTAEILELIQGLKEQGFDYEDEDIDHISQMEPDEAFAYLMFGLGSLGIDPEEFLTEKGYASAFELLREEADST